jgi:hypothetical protein
MRREFASANSDITASSSDSEHPSRFHPVWRFTQWKKGALKDELHCIFCDLEVNSTKSERAVSHILHDNCIIPNQGVEYRTKEELVKLKEEAVKELRITPKRRKINGQENEVVTGFNNLFDLGDNASHDDDLQFQFTQQIALLVFSGGLPFSIVENEHFIKAIGLLSDQIHLPNRKALSTSILDDNYDWMKKKVDTEIQRAKEGGISLCASTDGWTDIHGESIINWTISTGENTFFVEAKNTGDISHTTEFFEKEIENFISLNESVTGIITDSLSPLLIAKDKLAKKHPHIFFLNCACHGISLAVHDLVRDHLFKIHEEATSIIHFSTTRQVPGSRYRARLVWENNQLEHKIPCISLQAPTRWTSAAVMVNNLLKNHDVLVFLVNQPDFLSLSGSSGFEESARKVKSLICGEKEIWVKLGRAKMVLGPFLELSLLFESDQTPISCVIGNILAWIAWFKSKPDSWCKAAVGVLEDRWNNYIKHDAHLIANLLDPRYLGRDLSEFEQQGAISYLQTFFESNSQKIECNVELGKFNSRIKTLDVIRRDALAKLTPMQFWTGFDDFPLLKHIAVKVFALKTSASSCERMWSGYGFIQNRVRNRLTSERARKLLYLFMNLRSYQYAVETTTISFLDNLEEVASTEVEQDVHSVPFQIKEE